MAEVRAVVNELLMHKVGWNFMGILSRVNIQKMIE